MITLSKLTQKIKDSDNFSFIKLGDGELLCMLNAEGENCDGHPYSKELGDALKNAYSFLSSMRNSYITSWTLSFKEEQKHFGFKNNADGRLLIHQDISNDKYEFYKTLKFSNRRKIFIGPERLKGVISFLNVDIFIEIPLKNSFSYKFDITPQDNDIYMFSAGMPSKVWIANLLKKNKDITCIDFGSAFDPIFVGATRTFQVPMDVLKIFYEKLL